MNMYFGQYLINQQVITEIELDLALSEQVKFGRPIGETLVQLGYIDKEAMEKHLEQHLLNCVEIMESDPMFQIDE